MPDDFYKTYGLEEPANASVISPQVSDDEFYKKYDLQEPLKASVYASRGNNFGENLNTDIQDMVRSGKVLGNLGYLRARETLEGQSPIREQDLFDLQKASEGMKQYFENEYVKPFAKPDYVSYLANHFMKSPLGTFFDIGAGGLGAEALKAVGSDISMGRVLENLAPKAQMLGNKIAPEGSKLAQLGTLAVNAKRKLPIAGEGAKLVGQIKKSVQLGDEARLRKMAKMNQELDAAWNQLTPEEAGYMLPAAELTDRKARQIASRSPTMQNALKIARRYGIEYRKLFGIPDEEHTVAAYGPMYLTNRARQGLSPISFADLKKPEHFKNLMRLRNRLEKMGETPIHAAIATRESVDKWLHDAWTQFMGGLQGKTAKAAKREGLSGKFAVNQADRPEFLKERETSQAQQTPFQSGQGTFESVRLPKHEVDLKKLVQDRMYQAYRYAAIRDAVVDIARIEKPVGSNWEGIDVYKELLDQAKKFGGDAKKTEKELAKMGVTKDNGTIFLPEKAARIFKAAIGTSADAPGWLSKTYTTGMFGLDPTFGPRLAVQTAVLQGLTIKSPRDFASLLAGHVLASQSRAAEIIPDAVMLSHGEMVGDPALLKAGISFKKLMAEKARFDYGLHNFQRRAAALSYILHTAKNANAPIRKVIADMFDTSAALEEATSKVVTPAQVKRLQTHLKGIYGDYSALSYANRRTLQKIFPLAAWMAHAGQLIMSVPIRHPLKTSLYHQFTQVSGQFQQGLSQYAKEGGGVPAHKRGPGGGQMYMVSGHLDPLESGLELVEDAGALIFNPNHSFHIPSASSPIISIVAEARTSVDLRSRKRFVEENPELEKRHGKFYDAQGKEIEESQPHLLMIGAQNLLPKQMSSIASWSASNAQSTRFSYPGHPAAKRIRGRILPVKLAEKIWRELGMSEQEDLP